ncbi:MAG: sodium-independent anion transporter [Myxococcales bacterium]
MHALSRRLPSLDWLLRYRREDLGGDLSAGLTTAVMLVPQGMAYAMLAGLPPITGLYASILPLVAYALLGSSRQLAVGPVAMVSLLVASGVGALAQGGTEAYLGHAVLLALMVGVMQVVMGAGRLGFLVNFLSHPVVSGFTSAAALIIGASQLKHLLGVDLPQGVEGAAVAISRIAEWHWPTVAVGGAAVVALVALQRLAPRFPRALAVVVAGTLAVWALGLEGAGVRVVGSVPAGLPTLGVPAWSWDALRSLLPIALTISLVGFMESVSVAKAFAQRSGRDIDPNQELIALGAANVAASVSGALPVTGGFSRTAVNAQAGARTGLASLVTAAMVALTLLFLTPLFRGLPTAVLAAIILTAVAGLVDLKEVRHLWWVKRGDLALLGTTFVATLGLGIEEGILVGVGASLLWFVVRSTRPHFAVLGRLPGSTVWRNVRNFPEARTVPGVLVVRIDAQLYFGNVSFLKETLRSLETEPLRAVVLDASAVNQLDSSAEVALQELLDAWTARGVRLAIASAKGPVREVMERSGLAERLGAGMCLTTEEAVAAVLGAPPLSAQLVDAPQPGATPVAPLATVPAVA